MAMQFKPQWQNSTAKEEAQGIGQRTILMQGETDYAGVESVTLATFNNLDGITNRNLIVMLQAAEWQTGSTAQIRLTAEAMDALIAKYCELTSQRLVPHYPDEQPKRQQRKPRQQPVRGA